MPAPASAPSASTPPALPRTPLSGRIVRLEPLTTAHAEDLRAAASGDRSSFGFTWVPQPDAVDAYIATLLEAAAAGVQSPYAQIEAASGRAVGHTSFYDPRHARDGVTLVAVEVGYTWLAPSVQASAFNTESKLLMLTQAFEVLGVERVDLKTDARNARSRAAIAAIGGVFEGVSRRLGFSRVEGEEGQLRDTAVFSLIRAEWPATKAALEERVARKSSPARGSQELS